jgi:hypothetical protein
MRHCCSVNPCSRKLGRNCRITASRARNSDIGSEREKSRIGTCLPDDGGLTDPDILRAMLEVPSNFCTATKHDSI